MAVGPSQTQPGEPFLRPRDAGALLAAHCAELGAEGGALLAVARDGRVEIAGVHPPPGPNAEPPRWLTASLVAAGDVVADGQTVTRPLHDADQLYGQPAGRHLVLAPVAGGDKRGVLAWVKKTSDPAELEAAVEELHAQVSARDLYGLCLAARPGRGAHPQLAPALACLAAVNEHERFLPAAMALCNEAAARWRCDRVGLGFVVHGCVELKALSHTESFRRRTQAVQRIEAAMEECLDQDVEVAWPEADDAEAICRGARALSASENHTAVLSLPLRRGGEPVAVLTAERAGRTPFTAEEIESLRLTCELAAPRLVDLRRHDRWIGAKAAGGLRRALAGLVGPRHTWLKLLLAFLITGGLYVGLAEDEYRLRVPFTFQPVRRQVVPARFRGEIENVFVDLGDAVRPGDKLAVLRTLPLERRRSALQAERFEQQKQADAARAAKQWAQAQMAGARARQLSEQLDLLAWQIEQATVRARIDGAVVRGEARSLIGAAVDTGQVLFEIQTVDRLRAELAVPEEEVSELLAAMREGKVRGRLAAASFPDRTVPFIVERVLPLGDESGGEVVFTARAEMEIEKARPWMRPGMKGVAQVKLGRRSLAWIWTRGLVNRLRLWLWR